MFIMLTSLLQVADSNIRLRHSCFCITQLVARGSQAVRGSDPQRRLDQSGTGVFCTSRFSYIQFIQPPTGDALPAVRAPTNILLVVPLHTGLSLSGPLSYVQSNLGDMAGHRSIWVLSPALVRLVFFRGCSPDTAFVYSDASNIRLVPNVEFPQQTHKV